MDDECFKGFFHTPSMEFRTKTKVFPFEIVSFFNVIDYNYLAETLGCNLKGTIINNHLSFNPEDIVEIYIKSIDAYKSFENGWDFFNKKGDSFRSLLSSKGITPTNETKVLILERI